MIELQERLYTSTEVAEILGVSLRSVYRYLEENKLNAEVKTATGRHRFTKKNILDFLYPDGATTPRSLEEKSEKFVQKETPVVKEVPSPKIEPEVVAEVEPAPVTQDVLEEEEQVDWLAKFREAAKKFKEEENVLEETTVSYEEEVVVASQPASASEESISGLGITSEPEVAAEIEQPPESTMHYYKSGLGGLKDIAQNVDKNGRNSGVEYAFTLNAGLSLFKPIRPFSLLHVYIKPTDRDFYEKVLKLSPSQEDDSQLCLIMSSDEKIFDSKSEIHGLYVVSKEQLLKDIKEMGDSTLLSEAQSVLI